MTVIKKLASVKTLAKKAKAARKAAPPVKSVTVQEIPEVTPVGQEISLQGLADDILRANGVKPAVDETGATVSNPPVSTAGETVTHDELTVSIDTWNCKDLAPITLRSDRNVLHRFDYVPAAMVLPNGKSTGYSILQCSDNGQIVGKPFNPKTYSVLNNAGFIGIIEKICAVLEKMGIKYEIATTGTLMTRERSFISIKLDNTSAVIDGREIHSFLNCLNSIPSTSGCTVTFANNTFTVCCRNTYAHVLQGKDGAKFHASVKHTSGMNASLADVPVLVEAYLSGNVALFETLKSFAVFPVGIVDAENYFAAFLGRDAKGNLTDKTELSTRSANIVDTLTKLFVNGRGNKGQTAFDVFNAVTEYYTHFSAGESDDRLKQYTSSEAGDGLRSKQEFFTWLLNATQAGAAGLNFSAVAKVGETLLVSYRKK